MPLPGVGISGGGSVAGLAKMFGLRPATPPRPSYEERRATSRQRGYDGRWAKARFTYLAHHPLCAMCGDPATVVDHIVPHEGDQARFWDVTNWQPLCKPCHDGPKQRADRRRR